MAKGWTSIETIYSLKNKPKTQAEKRKEAKSYKRLMSTTKTLSVADLKKQSKEFYKQNKEKEDNLLQAFEDKKLKSKNAIKQAIQIKKKSEKKNDAKQDIEKVSNNETMDSTV